MKIVSVKIYFLYISKIISISEKISILDLALFCIETQMFIYIFYTLFFSHPCFLLSTLGSIDFFSPLAKSYSFLSSLIFSFKLTLFSLFKLMTSNGLLVSLVLLSRFSFNWSCLSLQNFFFTNFYLQQHCMKIVVDNNFIYAFCTNNFRTYFCMVTMILHCCITISS